MDETAVVAQSGSRANNDGAARSSIVAALARGGVALLAFVAIAWLGADYPLGAQWLFLGVAVYAALLWWRPSLWLIAVPALLPTLDLMRWTGSIALGEGDFLILTTFAVLALRAPVSAWRVRPSLATLLVGLLALSYTVSTLRGLEPFPPLDANSFITYLSPYNALRVAKGFLEAVLLLPFLRDAIDAPGGWRRLSLGMALGLAAVSVVVVVERLLIVEFFDLHTILRVTGPFMTMHVGGGHLSGFLMLALPFLAVLVALANRKRMMLALATLVLGLVVYAMVVTFDRTLYGASLAGVVVLVAASAVSALRGGRKFRLWVLLVFAGLAFLPLPTAALFSPFMKLRLSVLAQSFADRVETWEDGMALRDNTVATRLFGMGIGSYPRVNAAADDDPPTRFSLATEGGRTYLHIDSGLPLYIGQLVAIRPHQRYTLAFDFRVPSAATEVAIFVCEKTLLYSFRCLTREALAATPGQWESARFSFDSRRVSEGRLFDRPVELAIASARGGGRFDITNLILTDEAGTALLVNGDFARGMAHWLFTDDVHSAWRIENQALMLLFEQGGLGLVALLGIVAAAVIRTGGAITRGDPVAPAVLAALVGFGAVGLFNSLLEAPRLATLFYLVVFAALVGWRETNSRALLSGDHRG